MAGDPAVVKVEMMVAVWVEASEVTKVEETAAVRVGLLVAEREALMVGAQEDRKAVV